MSERWQMTCEWCGTISPWFDDQAEAIRWLPLHLDDCPNYKPGTNDE